MILFSDKKTGNIIGSIDGRIHPEDHLNMWIGDKNETERMIVEWKPFQWFDKDGKEIDKDAKDAEGNSLVFAANFEADHPQKDLFEDFGRKSNDPKRQRIYDYRIDLKTKKLIKIKDDGKNK